MRKNITVTAVCETCRGWVEVTWSPTKRQWICGDCSSSKVRLPSPGSLDAVIEGCECDPDLNDQGRLQPEIGWYVFNGCPIHDPPWAEDTE